MTDTAIALFPVVQVGDLQFSRAEPELATRAVVRVALERKPCAVHLGNAHTVSLAAREPELARAITSSGVTFPDGKPITWVARLKRLPAPQVKGPLLFERVFEAGQEPGLTHYLLGSTDETLEKLCASLMSRYPNAKIVGAKSPPFRALSDDELAEQDESIRASGAHIVWVGLGTPKQDYEVQRLARSLPIVAVAVGAAFDFSAGTKKTAPEWMSAVGLEWMFRLLSEPRRLWRRYLLGNFVFVGAAMKSWSAR